MRTNPGRTKPRSCSFYRFDVLPTPFLVKILTCSEKLLKDSSAKKALANEKLLRAWTRSQKK